MIVSSHYSHTAGSGLAQLCESHTESESGVSPVKQSQGQTGLVLAAIVAFASSICLTGCQTTIGGQTLPSPGYLTDDVQYFPAGPENPLANKVAAQRKYNAERASLGENLSGGAY
jgi:hypothetical protein